MNKQRGTFANKYFKHRFLLQKLHPSKSSDLDVRLVRQVFVLDIFVTHSDILRRDFFKSPQLDAK